MLTDEVYKWYQDNHLDPWDFECPHLPECSAEADEFTTARPPLIGQRYERHSLPRLLVISSDAGSGDPLSEKGEFQPSGSDPRAHEHPKRKHWSETLKLVIEIQRRFDADLQLEEATMCFAHERAVKCCENRHASSEARYELFRNCRDFIPRQLPVYRPDVILTQGNRAKWAVNRGEYDGLSDWTTCGHQSHDCEFRRLPVSDDIQPLWIHTYHPTSRAQYYPRYRKGYFKCYPELVAETLGGW